MDKKYDFYSQIIQASTDTVMKPHFNSLLCNRRNKKKPGPGSCKPKQGGQAALTLMELEEREEADTPPLVSAGLVAWWWRAARSCSTHSRGFSHWDTSVLQL